MSGRAPDVPTHASVLQEFWRAYPEGSFQPMLLDSGPFRVVSVQGTDKNGDVIQQTFVVVAVRAFRNPQDNTPGIGMAWEIFPSRDPSARGRELMMAETAAWCRAALAAGIMPTAPQPPASPPGPVSQDPVPAEDDDWAARAVGVLQSGGLLPLPTDQASVPPTDRTLMNVSMRLAALGVTDRNVKLRVLEKLTKRPPGSLPSSRALSGEAEALRLMRLLGGVNDLDTLVPGWRSVDADK